ncbi:hypothetical protein SAMN05216223_114139 [Actinacidiphila yanglinensis]|uniref:Uncharacterized protein n=1 Tax=Actinacidiphila yanglinensis TaxID=310779 RepID=A0A1H6DET4_9ACTN|nr:hypothetical protein [Actinacidiphila yanglinensis]SEG83744.1 hypothetical protein SAMN05216223_114139 [Actinacidiphila yanglinensis]
MSSRPDLVGVVGSARALGSLAALSGAVGALPVLLGHTKGLNGTVVAVIGVLLFGIPCAWFAGPRRAWYRARLEAAVPAPDGSVVTAPEDTFERVTRPMTSTVVVTIGVGLLIACTTGVPAGLVLTGVGAGLLIQARWVARQERVKGVRLLCPASPGRVAADDPHLSAYQEVPFYTVPARA